MIEIVDDKLFYIFRIKYQTPADKRNIVVIDLNRINNLGYDDKLFEIKIRICIHSQTWIMAQYG